VSNSITLVGRATGEIFTRYYESGSVCATFKLAVRRRHQKDDQDIFNLELWGGEAQKAADHVKDGTRVGIIGSVRIGNWSDIKTGKEITEPVVRVDRLEILEPPLKK
jgi:single-strand DNA-binding protein